MFQQAINVDTILKNYDTVTIQFEKQFLNCTVMEHNTLTDQSINASVTNPTEDHPPVSPQLLKAMNPSALDPRFNKVDAVVAWLNERIEMRFYAPGARVPSVRQLADKLGVSRFTVVNAYEKMVAAGTLTSRAGSGFYVAQAIHVAKSEPDSAQKNLLAFQETSVVDAKWLLRHLFSDLPDDRTPGSGILPRSWLENERMGVAVRAVTRSTDAHIYDYGHVSGYAPLREQIVVQLHPLGIHAQPDQVVTTNGVSMAIDLVARYFLNPGDAVLVDDPCWFWLYGCLQAQGLRVIPVPREPDGPNIDVLTHIMQTERPKLYVTNSVLHNPTSYGVTPARAYQVLRLLEEYDAYMLEDDIYGDLHTGLSKGAPALRYAALDQLKRVFYIASFSKCLGADLRVGLLCCPQEHTQGIIMRKMLSAMVCSELNERIVHRLLIDGQQRRHLEKLRQRLATAHEQMRVQLPKIGLQYPEHAQEGIFLWIDTGVDTNALALAAKNDGWLVAPGSLFSPKLGASTMMRLNVTRTTDAFFAWLGHYLEQHKTP